MGKILGLLGAAIAPPAAAYVTFLQAWAKAHPVLALLVLAGYELVVLGFGFVSKLVGGTADELRDRWKDPLARTIDEGTRRRLSRFERRYRESVLGSLRFIDLKGLATMGFYTPELDEVFVDVSLVHSDPSKVPTDVLGRPRVQPDRRFIGDLFDRQRPVVLAVIGPPGCGKTTLLRHTALLVCRTRRRRRRIPVLLYLRDHVQAITDGTALPDLADHKAPAGWFERKLRAGSCVVLLDGLDEVADQQNRREVSDWVERQVECFPSNDFVITSRPHGYQSAPVSGADIVQVRGFTDQQVTRFVRGWYFAFEQRSTGEKSPDIARRAEEEANDLLERLHRNTSLYELTVNPLLLTMIANVHKFRGALPGSRVDLYSEICQVLLWRRQEAKKLSSALSGDQKMTLLSELAYSMMNRRVRDIGRDQIAVNVRSALRRMAPGMDEEGFLADMTSSGLLLERERDVFAFAHLTFQEYLAAHHIREKQLTQVLIDNIDDVWWRETTLLHVARASADPVVRACLDSGTVRALSLAFDCAEQGSELAPELRRKLDQLLETVSEPAAKTPMRDLMIKVVVSRYLRNVVRTGEGTRLCAEPVPTHIYQLFLETEPHRTPSTPLGDRDEPVQGVWFEDALVFIDWVNSDAATEQSFRLPQRTELLSSPLVSKLGALNPWLANQGILRGAADANYTIKQNDLRADLMEDFSQLNVATYSIYEAELPVVRLTQPPVISTDETVVGRATAAAASSRAGSTSPDQFARAFVNAAVGRWGSTSYSTTIGTHSDRRHELEQVPLTAWGRAHLPELSDLATAVFSRAVHLSPVRAAELRVAAMCLMAETDEEHRDPFLWIAVGASIMQRGADGRLPANETIVLATD